MYGIPEARKAVDAAWLELDAAQARVDEISVSLSEATAVLHQAEASHMQAVYCLRALELQNIPEER